MAFLLRSLPGLPKFPIDCYVLKQRDCRSDGKIRQALVNVQAQWNNKESELETNIFNYLITESEVVAGKSQTEASPY